MSPKRGAILALALLVPAPSVGAFLGMVVFPNSLTGALLFGASKVWLFGLPVVWLRFVDHEPVSLSPPRQGGFGPGVLSGVLLAGLILAAYWALGDLLIDKPFLRDRLAAVGLAAPGRYAGGALYWVLVNSVLEEYVWRWFCVTQCERLMPKRAAVLCSAAFFTLHHIVATAVYFSPATVAVCALGVFTGGAIWSLMYVRYRSVWPGYVSHAFADLAIFAIGASLLFGAP